MQPSSLSRPQDSYAPYAPPLKQEPRKRLPLNAFSCIPNQPSPNHPKSQLGYNILPIPGHPSGVYAQRIAIFNAAALLRQPSEPSSSLYSSHPRPQVAQPLFFPGTSNPSLWGLSGLVGIPNTGSGAGGWADAPRRQIPNAPLGGQSLVNSTTFTTCTCPSCAVACQPLLRVPPQPAPGPPRLRSSALPSLPPPSFRPQAGTSGVPAQAQSIFGDEEEEDWDPLEPRHQLLPSSYHTYEPPSTLRHGNVSFTLLQFLGKGAAGRVVLGEHRGKLYAIKGIHKRCAQKFRHTRDDFLRERACMAAISTVERSKRFLMPLFMSWEEPEMIYFVMPFYPVDLHGALKSGLPTWADRYLYCQELICSLCEMRRLGIMHRDIKPSNILIAEDGRAVLTDFGMAQLVHPAAYEVWQRAGYSGTFSYMAPEMVRDGSVHGTVADVWSMALVFLEILAIAPERYFKSTDVEGIRREHATMLPVDSAVQPALDPHNPGMASLVISMLQSDPEKRITAQRLQGEYVLSKEWSNVREGYAAHHWKPHAGLLPRPPAGRLLDFLTFRVHDDPVEAMRDGLQVRDAAQFEYRAPGVFEFPENVVAAAYRL